MKASNYQTTMFFIDWVNNYLSIERIARDYNITKRKAKRLIRQGRKLVNSR